MFESEVAERRLIEVVDEMLPGVFTAEELERDDDIWMMRSVDTSFPEPDVLFVSLDGQTIPSDWYAIREFGVRHGGSSEMHWYRTDTERIVRIYPSSRPDHLAVTLIPKRNHPGARWTETLVRFISPEKIDAIKLVSGRKVLVSIAPAFEVGRQVNIDD